jgi:hypothetical protein
MRQFFESRLAAFLLHLNTHKFFWVGVGFGVPSVLVLGARDLGVNDWAGAHLGIIGWPVKAFIDGCADIALYVLLPAIVTAAFSRPPNIPK